MSEPFPQSEPRPVVLFAEAEEESKGNSSSGGGSSSRKKKHKRGATAPTTSRAYKSLSALIETDGGKEGGGGGAVCSRHSKASAGPPMAPAVKTCDVCGLLGKYTCVICGTYYCRKKCLAHHTETRCSAWAT